MEIAIWSVPSYFASGSSEMVMESTSVGGSDVWASSSISELVPMEFTLTFQQLKPRGSLHFEWNKMFVSLSVITGCKCLGSTWDREKKANLRSFSMHDKIRLHKAPSRHSSLYQEMGLPFSSTMRMKEFWYDLLNLRLISKQNRIWRIGNHWKVVFKPIPITRHAKGIAGDMSWIALAENSLYWHFSSQSGKWQHNLEH